MTKINSKKDKKPDLVVFDELTKRYDAAFKPYATDHGAPQIKPTNNGSWKSSQIYKANKQLKAKYEALKAEYESLLETLSYNQLVTSAKFTFEPTVGEIYHLYNNKKEEPFLSIIPPNQCNFKYLGSFKLIPEYLWEKVNLSKSNQLTTK